MSKLNFCIALTSPILVGLGTFAGVAMISHPAAGGDSSKASTSLAVNATAAAEHRDSGPTVQTYDADYPAYSTAEDLIAEADAVVIGEVVSSKLKLLYPATSTDTDPAVNPQAGVPASEVAKIPPIVATELTFRVSESLAGAPAVGRNIAIVQLGGTYNGTRYVEADATPLSISSGQVLLTLRASEDGREFGVINTEQSIYKVSKNGDLAASRSDNTLGLESIDQVKTVVSESSDSFAKS